MLFFTQAGTLLFTFSRIFSRPAANCSYDFYPYTTRKMWHSADIDLI